MTETRTVSDRLREMRDDMLLVVSAYNSVGEYHCALEAQGLLIALHKFEDDHAIHTEVAWPPRKDPDDPYDLESPPERDT